jgi:hypothetical protein
MRIAVADALADSVPVVEAKKIMLSDPIIRPRLLRLRVAPSSPHW